MNVVKIELFFFNPGYKQGTSLHRLLLGCSPSPAYLVKKVINVYPESSKADFFAQRLFEHSVIQNHFIAIR